MSVRSRGILAATTVAVLTVTGCSAAASSDDAEALDEISVAAVEPDPNLIPGRQTNAYSLVMSLFSPLTFLDAEGELSMLAAESVESDDQTTWTITLREGWTFHDGAPVTAQDYVDSWNAVAYGPNAWENSGQLAEIVGFDELNVEDGEPATDQLSGLRVIDERAFSVTLVRPNSQFPIQLSQAQTAFYPMPAIAFDDLEAYGEHPIGNGPFALTAAWSEGEPIVADRYAEFAGQAPTLDRITWVPYSDRLTAYNDVVAGNLDLVRLPANRMVQVTSDFDESQIHSFSAPAINYLGIPFWDERFDDVRVRQAISMAIDREAINDALFGGLYTPATAWTPSVMPGNPDGVCGDYCEFDPERARALLEEAGGFEGQLTVEFPGGAGHDDVYNAIANSLRQHLGVDAVAHPSVGFAEFSDARRGELLEGPFFSRWGALYPSQQSTLRAMFTSGGGCTNCGGAIIPEFEAALEAADSTSGADGEAYAQAQELLAEHFPVVPLFEETYNFVTSDRIAELPASGIGEPIFTDIVLAEN